MTFDNSVAAVNVNPEELAKFAGLAATWWDPAGPQKPLHILNPLRCAYIAQRVMLPEARILDVGCGGGLLSEALARRGARVVGIDLADTLIACARHHSQSHQVDVDYRVQSIEAIAAEQPASFDVITCMEMLEHVPYPSRIIAACATLLKPGGHLFVATINRHPLAFALAIVGAEYIARILPRGTHHYHALIQPSELARWLRSAGFALHNVSGVRYWPVIDQAHLSADTRVNYMVHAQKSFAPSSVQSDGARG